MQQERKADRSLRVAMFKCGWSCLHSPYVSMAYCALCSIYMLPCLNVGGVASIPPTFLWHIVPYALFTCCHV